MKLYSFDEEDDQFSLSADRIDTDEIEYGISEGNRLLDNIKKVLDITDDPVMIDKLEKAELAVQETIDELTEMLENCNEE